MEVRECALDLQNPGRWAGCVPSILPRQSASLLPVPCHPVRTAAAPWARCVVLGTEMPLRPISLSGTRGGQCWRNVSCGVEAPWGPVPVTRCSLGACCAGAVPDFCSRLVARRREWGSGSGVAASSRHSGCHRHLHEPGSCLSHFPPGCGTVVSWALAGVREGTRSVPLLSGPCHKAVTSSGMSRSWKTGWPGGSSRCWELPPLSAGCQPPLLDCASAHCHHVWVPEPSCSEPWDTGHAHGFASAHSPPGREAT